MRVKPLTNPRIATIAEPSFKSLFIQMYYKEQILSCGTGFVVFSRRGPLLITNRHNVTGRHQDSSKPLSSTGGLPDRIKIFHNYLGQIGRWIEKDELLFSNEKPRWIEHPRLGKEADLVALPLVNTAFVHMHVYDPGNSDPDILVGPSETVSVVGFPFGLRAGGSLAIWATGFIASEPEIDYDNKPIFLIDCRSRQGQSGSAVIAYRGGGMTAMQGGLGMLYSGPVFRFLGIYSGRIRPDSDIGIVWKTAAISELVASV